MRGWGCEMSRGTNQKLKLLYMAKIMLEKTDDNHKITMHEVLAELAKYDVTAEQTLWNV